MAEEKTIRQKAIEAIQAGYSVRLGDSLYTLTGNKETGAKSINELPGDEVFAKGDAAATAEAMDTMKKQMADLQARYDALKQESKASPAPAPKADAKVDTKEEAK